MVTAQMRALLIVPFILSSCVRGIPNVDGSSIAEDNADKSDGLSATWSPRPPVYGWGPNRHGQVLRVKDSDRPIPARFRPEWKKWRSTLGAHRSYHNSSHEEWHARIFEETEQMVLENLIAYAKGEVSYYMAINQFADKSEDESMGIPFSADTTNDEEAIQNDSLGMMSPSVPSQFDWRDHIKFNAVKNQQQCGSCICFSSVASIEAQIAIKYNVSVDLSEQQILDCTYKTYTYSGGTFNNGCEGGIEPAAFDWLKKYNRSLAFNSDYPYTSGQSRLHDKCQDKYGSPLYKIKNYSMLKPKLEESIKEILLTKGPVTSHIRAEKVKAMSSYSGGVYDDSTCDNQDVNHSILTIGYGTENGKDYWLIRNSWGTGWGKDGYLKLLRGAHKCGFPGLWITTLELY